VDSKSRETDYEMVKATCLKLTNSLNAAVVKQSQLGGGGAGGGGANFYSAQAKGNW
jgi:hypothetical protein